MKEIKFINARVIDPIQKKNNVLETIFISPEGKIENISSSDGYDVIHDRVFFGFHLSAINYQMKMF